MTSLKRIKYFPKKKQITKLKVPIKKKILSTAKKQDPTPKRLCVGTTSTTQLKIPGMSFLFDLWLLKTSFTSYNTMLTCYLMFTKLNSTIMVVQVVLITQMQEKYIFVPPENT